MKALRLVLAIVAGMLVGALGGIVAGMIVPGCASAVPSCRTPEEIERGRHELFQRAALALGSCVFTLAAAQGTDEAGAGDRTTTTTGVAAVLVCASAGVAAIIGSQRESPEVCPDPSLRAGGAPVPSDAGVD